MTDTELRALIASMREQEQAARGERAQFDQWTEHKIEQIFDPNNAEVARLMSDPVANPEVDRLARIAAEVAPKTK